MKLTGITIDDHYQHPLSVKQGADDQLNYDQKQVDEQFNPDWLKTKEHYEEIIRGIVKEHSELVGEIKPYINHREDCLIYRGNYHQALWNAFSTQTIERECNCGVTALKQKFGAE